jgi:hypothetical protein
MGRSEAYKERQEEIQAFRAYLVCEVPKCILRLDSD